MPYIEQMRLNDAATEMRAGAIITVAILTPTQFDDYRPLDSRRIYS